MQKFITKTSALFSVLAAAFLLVWCWTPSWTPETADTNTDTDTQIAVQNDSTWTAQQDTDTTTSGSAYTESQEEVNKSIEEKTAEINSANAETKPSENYQVYSEEKFDAALKAGKNVALFFYSASSDISTRVDKDLANNSTLIGEDNIVFRVDFDENADLKDKYEVKKENTTVYLNSDTSIKKTDKNAVGVTQVISGF